MYINKFNAIEIQDTLSMPVLNLLKQSCE